jgi:hypothetical protein
MFSLNLSIQQYSITALIASFPASQFAGQTSPFLNVCTHQPYVNTRLRYDQVAYRLHFRGKFFQLR